MTMKKVRVAAVVAARMKGKRAVQEIVTIASEIKLFS